MILKVMRLFVAILAACVAFGPAQAALLNFDLTGSRSASFQLDSDPTPDSFSSSVFGSQIHFLGVTGQFGGATETATVSFGTGPIFNVLDISGTSLGFTQFAGPDLFTGPADMPVFAPGSFALTSIVSGSSNLTISLATVPLPPTLLLFGAGLAGFGLIRSRKSHASGALQ